MRLLKVIAFVLLISNINAQNSFCPNVDGSIEHALLTSYKNSCIVGYNEIKFDAVSFPLEKINIKGTEKQLTTEGKVIDIIYGIDNTKNATVLEVQRNYEQALKNGGFNILFSAFGRKKITARRSIRDTYPLFGSVDFMNTIQKLKNKNFRFVFSSHNTSQNNDYAYFLATGKKGNTKYTIALNIMYNRTSQKELNGNIFVQAKIVEAEEMDTDQVSTESIDEKIKNEGKEVFHNILFDFGSDVLTPESYSVIKVLAKYLTNNKDKSYYIVGHTDNVGSLSTNQTLSEKRAKAVLKALTTKYGVNTTQVSAHGVGQLSPLAINTTEEGRALNRRVEIVLK
jgi:outer membrane protein OmpA-like peptidoglycan-associated protein